MENIKINEIKAESVFSEIDPYIGGICGLGCNGDTGSWCGVWCDK